METEEVPYGDSWLRWRDSHIDRIWRQPWESVTRADRIAGIAVVERAFVALTDPRMPDAVEASGIPWAWNIFGGPSEWFVHLRRGGQITVVLDAVEEQIGPLAPRHPVLAVSPLDSMLRWMRHRAAADPDRLDLARAEPLARRVHAVLGHPVPDDDAVDPWFHEPWRDSVGTFIGFFLQPGQIRGIERDVVAAEAFFEALGSVDG